MSFRDVCNRGKEVWEYGQQLLPVPQDFLTLLGTVIRGKFGSRTTDSGDTGDDRTANKFMQQLKNFFRNSDARRRDKGRKEMNERCEYIPK